MPGLGRRIANRLIAPYVLEIAERTAEVKAETERIGPRLDEVQTQLQQVLETVHREVTEMTGQRTQTAREEVEAAIDIAVEKVRAAAREETQLGFEQTRRMLRRIEDDTPADRRRLYALRESEKYELAWTEPDPLVSFVLPTYNRWEKLRDVALPSILAQTHANVEAVVVGDGAPPETAAAIAEIDDPRVRYYNRPVRGPYPDDPAVRWYMVGSPPYNDALALVRGRWIAAMADDDEVRPEFAETLLAAAREGRHENCYGRHRVVYPSGEVLTQGSFPPRYSEFVTQAAIYHSGLRFFQMSFGDPLYEEPNDWSLCRRMMDAGVRYGMIDAVVCDKHESRYDKHSDWSDRGVPEIE